MGTPEFAVPSLDALVDAGFRPAAVVTVPDRPQGRGQTLQPSAKKPPPAMTCGCSSPSASTTPSFSRS